MFCKLWPTGWRDSLFLFFSAFSVNLGISFEPFPSQFCKAKFSHEMFTHEISNWMARVNGKYPCLHNFSQRALNPQVLRFLYVNFELTLV